MSISFKIIYEENYTKAFHFVKSYVHDELIAEDIVSDVMLKLWKKLKEKTEDTPYKALLITMLKHESLDYLKHELVKKKAIDDITEWQQKELNLRISSLESCIPNELISADIEKIIKETLQTLPEQTRTIFLLSRKEFLSTLEIGHRLHISTKAVEYHITKALKKLRYNLRDYYIFLLFF